MLLLVRSALLLSFLVFIPGVLEQFQVPKAHVVRILGIGALASLAAALPFRRPAAASSQGESPSAPPGPPHRWPAMDVAMVAWLATEAAATAVSDSPRLSFFGDLDQHEGLLTSLGLAGLYFATRRAVRTDREARALLDTAIGAAAAASGYALLQLLGLDPARWHGTAGYGVGSESYTRPFGTLAHPNLLGVVTAPALASSLALAQLDRSRSWLYVLAALLFGAITVTTLSRAAWMGAALGMTLAVLLAAPGLDPKVRSRRVLWIGAALVALLVAGALLLGGGVIQRRFAEFFAPSGGTARTRYEIWKSALAMWRSRPWLGHGPDTFNLLFPAYQTPEFWRFEWGVQHFHAHSIYLHQLATRGVIGLGVAMATSAAASWAWVRAWRAGVSRGTLVGVLAALAAMGAAGGFGALGITGAAWVVVLLGTIASLAGIPAGNARSAGAQAAPRLRRTTPAGRVSGGRGAPGARKSSPLPRGARLTGWVAALVMLALGGMELAALQAAFEARDWLPRRAGESPARALRAAHRACALQPRSDLLAHLQGQTYLAASGFVTDPLPLVARAEAFERRAIALQPERALYHQGLGTALLREASLGKASLPQAEQAFQRALRLSPYNGLAMLELADGELSLGRPRQALSLARRAAELYPSQPLALRILASAALSAGDTVTARASVRALLALEPDRASEESLRLRQTLQSLER